MKIIRLKPGERAPDSADRIRIDRLPSGRYTVSGVCEPEIGRGAVFSAIHEKSVSSEGEAEAVGIRWASRMPISTLYIERPVNRDR